MNKEIYTNSDNFLTLKEVADMMKVSPKKIRSDMRRGLPYIEISTRPIYRFSENTVREWFKSRQIEA